MKMSEAMEKIKSYEKNGLKKKNEPIGFMVGFEKIEDGILCSGNFPDKHAGEKLIKTEAEAWKLAKRFSKAAGKDYVNIYVKDQCFRPVSGYREKKINKYRI